MLDHEREFYDTLKSKQAKAAFKAMLIDCDNSVREANSLRSSYTDPTTILSLTMETQRQKVVLRQYAMIEASKIDAEYLRVQAGAVLSLAHLNQDK